MTAQRRPRTRSEPAGKLKLRLWLRLLRASRALEVELRERMRLEFGVTLPKFDVMSALDRKGSGMTMTELSRFLMVSNGNVTGIVDRLVADGLVVRVSHHSDRRAIFVKLTREGIEQFAVMAKAHEAWVNEILSDFSREDSEALAGLLDRLKTQMQGTGRSTDGMA